MAFAGNPIGLWYPIRIPRIPGFEKFWKPTVTLSRSGLALQLAQPKDAVFHAGNHSCSLGVGSAFLEPTSAQGFPERGSGSRLYAEATEAGYPSPITIDQQTGLYFVALAPWEVLLSETILGNHPDQLSSLKAFQKPLARRSRITAFIDHPLALCVEARNVSLRKEVADRTVQHLEEKRLSSTIVDLVTQGAPILDITLFGCAHAERPVTEVLYLDMNGGRAVGYDPEIEPGRRGRSSAVSKPSAELSRR